MTKVVIKIEGLSLSDVILRYCCIDFSLGSLPPTPPPVLRVKQSLCWPSLYFSCDAVQYCNIRKSLGVGWSELMCVCVWMRVCVRVCVCWGFGGE